MKTDLKFISYLKSFKMLFTKSFETNLSSQVFIIYDKRTTKTARYQLDSNDDFTLW